MMVKVIVDHDPSLSYEQDSLVKKAANVFLVPILNNIPARLQSVIKRSHESAEEVIEHATTHRALEVLYHSGHPHRNQSLKSKLFHSIWFNTINSKAVRNRLQLVRREVTTALRRRTDRGEPVLVLSVAAGSARAVLESMAALGPKKKLVSAVFVDKNPHAIDYSRKLAEELIGDTTQVRWVIDSIGNFLAREATSYDLVEMVGLLDYFDDAKTITTASGIFRILKSDGIFITANIKDNPERPFVTKAIGWDMIYRTPEEFARLVVAAGFKETATKVFLEPLKVHSVLVASK
jgi:SAM-dependent methyltransferase